MSIYWYMYLGMRENIDDIQTQISKLIEPLYAKMLTARIVVLRFLQQVVVAMGDGVKQVLYQHGI